MAYLHRKEGDQDNAAYWYSRAGKPVCREPLDLERRSNDLGWHGSFCERVPDRASKLVCLEPVLEVPILLHKSLPFTSYLKLVRKLRTSVINDYSVPFSGSFPESNSRQESFPPGNKSEQLQVCKGRRRSSDILYVYFQEPGITLWSGHLNHIGESGHCQPWTSGKFCIDVPQ